MSSFWSPSDSSLADSPTSFPSDYVNPIKKREIHWCRQFSKAIYVKYLNGKLHSKPSNLNNMRSLRLYSQGRQPSSSYMDKFLGKKKKNAQGQWVRKGFMNVNWKVISFAPMIMDKIVGMFKEVEYDVQADLIGMEAGVEKETKKWRLYAQAMNKDLMAKAEAFGVAVPKMSFTPENAEQLEILDRAGGFKSKAEVTFEKIVQIGFESCDWSSIKDKMIEDLVAFYEAGCQDCYKEDSGVATARYLDPERIIAPYNRDYDFENIPYWGYIEDWTIHALRLTGEFEEDELKSIARSVHNYGGNTAVNSWHDCYNEKEDRYSYDEYNISVIYAEYKSVDSEFRTLRENQHGAKKFYRSSWGKKHNSAKKKTAVTEKENIYQCRLILGTEFCFDYGEKDYVERPTDDTARCSLHYKAIPRMSITERAEPLYDETCEVWYKKQNAIAKMHPSGFNVEVGALSNVVMGGKKYEPLELIEMKVQGGTLIYKAQIHTSTGAISSNKPIETTEGGMGRSQMMEFESLYMRNLNSIRDMIGLAPVAMPTSDTNQAGLGVNQMMEASTNDGLRPLIDAYHWIKGRVAQGIAHRARIQIRNNKKTYKSYYPLIGKTNLKVVKFTDKSLAEMGIKMKARPTATEKQNIMKMVQESLNTGKDGQAKIEIDEAFMIEELVNQGQLELARALLATMIKKRRDEQRAVAERNIKMQGENDQQRIAAELKSKMTEKNEDAKIEISKLNVKFEQEKALKAMDHDHMMEQLELEGRLEKEKQVEISGEL